MSKILVIGAGGVGSVAVHKMAMNADIFSHISLASRTKSKCDAIAKSVKERTGVDIDTYGLDAGEILPVKDLTYPTYCDALQTPQTYPVNFEILRRRVSQAVSVTTDEVATAMRVVFERLHLVVEPGGAVALAAVLAGKIQTKAVTAVTLSGGNVDQELFAQLLAQAA